MNDITAGNPGGLANVSEHLGIGARYNGGSPANFIDGEIDEARMSDTNRSDAWIKATYHSGNDNLNSYGAEETIAGGITDDWNTVPAANVEALNTVLAANISAINTAIQ